MRSAAAGWDRCQRGLVSCDEPGFRVAFENDGSWANQCLMSPKRKKPASSCAPLSPPPFLPRSLLRRKVPLADTKKVHPAGMPFVHINIMLAMSCCRSTGCRTKNDSSWIGRANVSPAPLPSLSYCVCMYILSLPAAAFDSPARLSYLHT